MTILKGKNYIFIVTVIEKDSFLPQDLTNMDIGNSSFELINLSTLCKVTSGTTTISIVDALNGILQIELDSVLTESLDYSRGDAVDNYYLKPTYQGIIQIKFTDSTLDRNAIIEKIYIAPVGVVCG